MISNIYIYTYTCIYIYMCMYIYIYVYIYNTYIYIYNIHIHMYIYIYIYLSIYIYIHVYIYIHDIYVYICIYVIYHLILTYHPMFCDVLPRCLCHCPPMQVAPVGCRRSSHGGVLRLRSARETRHQWVQDLCHCLSIENYRKLGSISIISIISISFDLIRL